MIGMSSEERDAILKEIVEQNDRGAAITAFAFMDETLAKVIQAKFIPLSTSKKKALFTGTGPLGTFEARANIAYALDLVSDAMLSDMKLVAQIRNKFAHRMAPIKFADKDINELCGNLKMGKFEPGAEPWTRDPRNKYVIACTLLIAMLTLSEAARIGHETKALERLLAARSARK